MANIENVLKILPDVSEMLFQMYKDETDKESISVRYDQYLAVDDALELLKEQQEQKEKWIRDIDLFIADAEDSAKNPAVRSGKGYAVGLSYGLTIAKEIIEGKRNHG